MKRDVFVRSALNYDMDQVSGETGLTMVDADGVVDKGFTQQHFAEEVDINTIVRRFGLTGELPDNVRVPVSGDFTSVVDFHTAMNAVTEAQAAFMELPAELRYRFANDPQRLMEFVADASNRDEARKLGLLRRDLAPLEPVAPVAPVAPAAPVAATPSKG